MDAIVPSSLKGYELKERIGAGGFGAVFRAYQSTVRREVAIKIILPGLANQPEFIRRFEAEAQIVARLEHPHIVPLHDYWRDPNGAYLVMRWLRGGNLYEALQKGDYAVSSAALLLDHIAGALSLAHRNHVIHRDIKPSNILLDEDGNAYLTDFGIAKDLIGTANNTQPDVIVGSLDYISPEQARSEAVTHRTDIYSLGVTFYEVLTGEHPFQNLSSVERIYKHINDPLPDITILDTALSDPVNRVIQKATAKNPEHRYADVLEFAAEFRQAITAQAVPISINIVELLTQREQEILQLIVDGKSNKEIAGELTVTLSTVKWYVNQIYAKLGVRSRVQAMVRARELNLLTKATEIIPISPIPTEYFHPKNPYKGLHAFQSADNQDFFGRETVTTKLVKRLEEAHEFKRFLAVVGPSGSGKSSIVKAGLIPALWRGDLPGSEKWFVVDMLPGAHPLDELEIALTRVAANQSGSLNEQLSRDIRGLIRAAQLILPADSSELVLVIDQFEEVFTLLEDEVTRTHFLDLLYTAVAEPRSRVRVIITLRADFYDRPLHYPDFGELIRSRMETLLPLSVQELERAISKPAERVGVSFETGLVAQVVAEVNYQAGALPLLQYALTELFEQRQGRVLTREAYQTMGGTVGALAKRAEEIYVGGAVSSQELVRQMFLRLVTLGEGVEDTRRRVARSELLTLSSDPDLMDEIIDTYAEYRLFSLDNDPHNRTPTVEVAHEAILHEWKRLREWLSENREDIRLQRQLAAMTDEWQRSGQEASFLVRAGRLDTFKKWSEETALVLTPREKLYLDTSIAHWVEERAVEEKRQALVAALERRSVRFLRILVAILLLGILSAFGLTGVAVYQSRLAKNNATKAQNVALVAGSQAALANGNTDSALALALQAVTLDPTSASAQVALAQAAYAPGTVRQFVGHTDEVWGVAFAPDVRTAISAADDKTLMLWDITTGAVIRQFADGHSKGHIKVSFSPDGKKLVSGADDGLVIIWDVASGSIIRRLEGHTGWIGDVKFSPDGRSILSCGQDQTLILWDVATGNMIRRLIGHESSVQDIAFSPDGQTVLSGADDGVMIVWAVATGRMIQKLKSDVEVNSVAISPDGHFALTTTFANTFVYLWDLTTGQLIRSLKGHTAITLTAVFSPDGQTSLSGSADNTIIQWNLQTGEVLKRLRGHTGDVHRIALSTDGRYVLSGSVDHTVRLWDLQSGQIIHRFSGHTKGISGAAFNPVADNILTNSLDGTAIVWDIQTGQKLQSLKVSPLESWGAAYSLDGHSALVGTADWSSQAFISGDIILWNLQTGSEIRRFSGQQAQIICVTLSPDGQTFLSGASDGSAFLWDLATGKLIRQFTGDSAQVWSIAFSPDGQTFLLGDFVGGLTLWDVKTGHLLKRLDGQYGRVSTIAFSRDNRTVLTGGIGGVFLWDVTQGTLLQKYSGMLSAAFSPDERTIFMGSVDGSNNLLDVGTGKIVRQYTDAGEGIGYPIFSHDGHSVLATFSDGRVEIWRIDTLDELISWTRANRYIPEVSCDQRGAYQLEPLCDSTLIASS